MPCEMVGLKNRNYPELSEANRCARLIHSKQLLTNIHNTDKSKILTKRYLQCRHRKTDSMSDSARLWQPRRKTSQQNVCAQD